MNKGVRLGIVLALVLAGGALAYAGAAPAAYKGVADALDDPALEGRELDLKATVVEGSLQRDAEPVAFRIADAGRDMRVQWDPAVPIPDHEAGGTIEGKNVVVRGVVQRDADGPYLLASSMIVGCASKYRAA